MQEDWDQHDYLEHRSGCWVAALNILSTGQQGKP